MPLPGAERVTEYYSVRSYITGTITATNTHTAVTIPTGSSFYDCFVINDGAGTITVTFNGTGTNGLPLAPYESYTEDKTEITSVYVKNESGTTTSYRMVLKGE